jgi:Mg-chelatase subunit ChlD
MDWKVVEIPAEYKFWSRERLLHTLLHEWGHRMISPLSPERGAILRKAAEKEGLSAKQAQQVVNVATDLWLDRQYLQDPSWKATYWEGLQVSVREARKKLGVEDAPWPAAFSALYARLLRDSAPTAEKQQSIVDPLEDALGESPTLEEETRSLARGLWEALYEGNTEQPGRVREVARMLRGVLPETQKVLVSVSHSFETGVDASLTPSLRQVGREAGLSAQDLSDLFGDSAEEIRRHTTRLDLYEAIVPVVEEFDSRPCQSRRQGHRRWTAGERTRELDAPASLQRAGALIPGVTTLAPRHAPKGQQEEKGCGRVCLVIDDSGSTSGSTLRREQEAAFAVIAAARRLGDPVGLVVFGSSVTASEAPTTKYDKLERKIAGLSSSSGGTELAPALSGALEHFSPTLGGALMIMTDAGFADQDAAGSKLNALPEGVTCTAFCFGEETSIRDAFSEVGASTCVYAASPEEPFAETALNALYGRND